MFILIPKRIHKTLASRNDKVISIFSIAKRRPERRIGVRRAMMLAFEHPVRSGRRYLAEAVAMPPGDEAASKTRFEMLLSPKEHEMHHRGQLMTLQRMIGLVPHLTRHMQERMAQVQAGAQAGR